MYPSVGVVIPTRDRPAETIRAVKSALDQTYTNLKVLVIDDGSTDEVLQILAQEIASLHDLRVSLHSGLKFNHPGIARNYGVKQLQCDWIAFLDSDDTWYKNKITKQLDFAEKNNAKAVFSNALRVTNGKNKSPFWSEKSKVISRSKLLRKNYVITSTTLVSRDLLKEVDYFAVSYASRGGEDYATWLRIASLTDWHYFGVCLADYADDSEDSMRTTDQIPNFYANFQGIIDYFNWKHFKSGEKNGFHRRLFLKLVLRIISMNDRGFKK
jgi:teichuronic acid biosynthesis glycosyltransferase TuaG